MDELRVAEVNGKYIIQRKIYKLEVEEPIRWVKALRYEYSTREEAESIMEDLKNGK